MYYIILYYIILPLSSFPRLPARPDIWIYSLYIGVYMCMRERSASIKRVYFCMCMRYMRYMR